MSAVQSLIDGVSLHAESQGDLRDLQTFDVPERADSPITFGQALEEALEIESFFEAVEPIFGGGDVRAVGKRYVGRATLDALTERPLHNHVYDDPVGNGVAPAALELGQQPFDHVVGDVVSSVPGPDEAALDDEPGTTPR